MGTQEFTVLYTHQKLKKAKVWQDGTLKIGHLGNKAILYDDKGQCLESIFLKCLEVKPGDDLEGDRYLITVEETKVAGSISAATTVVKGEANPRGCMSFGWSRGCQPVGLKRKFTGFQGPRQVPPKILVTESGGLATSLEAKKAGPLSLSPFHGTSPLFSTAGQKDIRNISADPGSTVAFENRERNDLPFSSVVSTPAFKIHPETIGHQNYFCLPISSENEHLHSLLTDEPVKRDSLPPHHSGISQNIRSKAQILALLKAKPPGLCRELSSECREQGTQEQSHNSVTILPEPKCLAEQEECAEGQLENLWSQQSLGNGTSKRSRWTRYLPSQRSSGLAETEEGNNITESGGKSNEDSSVSDNHNQLWDQEATLESPAFSENNGLTVTCSQVENDTLLLESDISENSKICIHPNRTMCQEESLLMRENAEEGNICGIVEVVSEPGPESEEPQREPSSFSNNSRVSDDITDMLFKSSTNYKGFDGCPEFRNGVEQPPVEVTFNLCGFEGSDIEEESQTSHEKSQDSEGWVKEALATCGHPGAQRPCEEVSGEEVGSDPLPLLMLDRGKPTESLSQFCDKTRAGFYPGTWRTENTGTVVEQKSSGDTLSKYDPSFEWLDDDKVENDEEASQWKVSLNNDFASFPNASKNTEKNVPMPHFSNTKTSLFSEECPPFILGNNVKDEQVLLPSASSSEDRVQLPDANPSHSEERIAFGELDTRLPSSSLYLQGTRHPILKDREVCTPESEDLGRFRTLPHNLKAVEAAGGKLHSNRPKNPSELSGSISNISLLKSLSAHSTALEGLELMRREKSAFKQQQSLQAYGPESRPEAGRSLMPIVSQAVPEFPHLNQDSPKMQKENELGPTEPLESPEVS